MRRLDLTRDALKFLDELPPRQFKQVTTTILGLLREPEPHDARLLKGYDYRRVDVGEYRVIYDFAEEEIRVLLIGQRNDDAVYQALRRK